MPYLDAALAFALTMLVVSTLVSQIVRLFRNTARLRNEEMKKMLADYYAKEVKPVIQRELNRLTTEVKEGVVDNLHKELDTYVPSLFGEEELKTLVDASTEEIKERLKRSTLGQQLLKNLGDKAQSIFDDLGKRYEVVGSRFTESFRAKSQQWATVIALILALAINIDSIHIANVYINNEGTRQAVIAQRDAFEDDYDNLVKALEQENQDSVTKDEIEDAFSDSKEQLNVLTSSGFPIGWSYFPHAYFQGEDGTSEEFQPRNNFLGWFTWFLGILLTGGLAGLGAPFWYDVVAGISRTVQSVRAAKKTETE